MGGRNERLAVRRKLDPRHDGARVAWVGEPQPAAVDLPQADNAVLAAGGKQLAVGRQGYATAGTLLSPRCRQFPPGPRIPNLNGSLPRGRGQQLAAGAEGERVDRPAGLL